MCRLPCRAAPKRPCRSWPRAGSYRSGGLGGPLNYTDIPAGPLSIRHVFDLYPFPDSLSVILQTGRDLRLRLEHSAGLLRRLTPGVADQILFDPDVPGFAFEVISGLSYRIDPTAPEGARIRDLSRKGRPVAEDDRFVFVSNSHDVGTLPRARGSSCRTMRCAPASSPSISAAAGASCG